MNIRSLLTAAAAACAWLGALPAPAALVYPIAPVVRSGEGIPGVTGGFTSFDAPNVSGDTIAFIGNGAGGSQGVFTYSPAAGYQTVADTSTLRPDGSGNFTGFFEVHSDGPNVAFREEGANGGIYDNTTSTLRLTAGTGTGVPGGGNFTSVRSPSVRGGKVAFVGSYGANGQGVFIRNGNTVTRIVDTTTKAPGSAVTFSAFFTTAVAGDDVTFGGYGPGGSGLQGIYTTRGGLHAVADTSTPIPGGTGSFTVFNISSYHATDGADTVFIGDGPDQEGIYARFGNAPLIRIADRNTFIPGTSQKLGYFGFNRGPAIDDGHILFWGSTSTASSDGGLFLYWEGLLSTVIRAGDALDGKTISTFSYSPESLSGNQAVFTARFTDGSSGIYAATVPEPAAVGVAVAAALFFPRRRRRA